MSVGADTKQNGGHLTDSSRGSSWASDGHGSVSKEEAAGADSFLPTTEGEGGGVSSVIVDLEADEGREEGEDSKDSAKLEGKGESYVLTLKVVLPGSSEPLTVMVSSIRYREEGGMEGGAVTLCLEHSVTGMTLLLLLSSRKCEWHLVMAEGIEMAPTSSSAHI